MTQDEPRQRYTDLVAQQLFEDWHQKFAGERVYDSTWGGVPSDLQGVAIDCAAGLFRDNPRGLFLLGPVGTGKTSVMWLIRRDYMLGMANRHPLQSDDFVPLENDSWAEHLIRQHWLAWAAGVMWYTYKELTTTLRRFAKYESDDSLMELYRHKLLFIDDLLRAEDEDATWNAQLVYELIDYRLRHRLPTFVTTNRTKDQLRALGSNWDATVDRLADPAWMVGWTLAGKSRRI